MSSSGWSRSGTGHGRQPASKALIPPQLPGSKTLPAKPPSGQAVWSCSEHLHSTGAERLSAASQTKLTVSPMQLDTACPCGQEEPCLPGLAQAGWQSVHKLYLLCCRAEAARVALDSRLKVVCKENEVKCNSLASNGAQLIRDLQEARESAGTRHQQIQASCRMLWLRNDRLGMRPGAVRAAAQYLHASGHVYTCSSLPDSCSCRKTASGFCISDRGTSHQSPNPLACRPSCRTCRPEQSMPSHELLWQTLN